MSESTSLIDAAFLQEVDDSLRSALGRVAELEMEQHEPLPVQSEDSWHTTMNRLHGRLDGWRDKLAAVAEEVERVEADLKQQQDSLLDWTATLETARRLTT